MKNNNFQSKSDKILRKIIKFFCYIHYKTVYLPKDKNLLSKYIPSSGKILDENELFNMVDASLDMWLTTGRFNNEFEKKLAEFLKIKHVLTTNSGSSANLLAISTLTSHKLNERRLKEGDEVITVAAGFPTTINPIIQNKLIPVFVDIEAGTYNINIDQVEKSITQRTKAIFIAHTLGNPFDIEKILEICSKYNLWLIEDNCDALGSRYKDKYTGTLGHIGTLSFYPAHHITMGEGGAVLTNDAELYKIAMSFRDWGRDCWCPPGKDNTCKKRFDYQLGNLPHGYDHKYTYSHLGYNLKITDWQAGIALAQLKKLPDFIERRKENFKLLYEGLKKFEEYFILPKSCENSDPSWFGFLLTVKNNDKFNKTDLVKYLENKGIATRQLFAGNMLRQPAFVKSDISLRILDSQVINSKNLSNEYYNLLPNTDLVMNNTFWIGLYPKITQKNIKYILQVLESAVKEGIPQDSSRV